ncbi:hypothetical protein Trydic_g22863 [Trypoxylus dichotomus]
MEDSTVNFELSASTVKVGSDSDPSSEKSDNFEEIIDDAEIPTNDPGPSKVEDFDNNLPETVTLLKHPITGAKVYLVGTAHFSQESKDEVVQIMNFVQPHIVVLELCDARISILQLDEAAVLEEARNINMENIMSTIRRNGVYYGITYLLLLNLNAHLTKQFGMAPGGEFRVAFQEAQKLGCAVKLGDRPIRITLLRALAKLSWFQTLKLGWHLLFTRDPISKEEVEKCKKRDMLEQLLADMSDEYPVLGKVFVDERDIFLTYSLQQAACANLQQLSPASPHDEPVRVVGVVGIGHVLGITKLWPKDQQAFIKDIIFIPPPSLTSKIIKAGFKLSMAALASYLIYRLVPVPKTLRNVIFFIHVSVSSTSKS